MNVIRSMYHPIILLRIFQLTSGRINDRILSSFVNNVFCVFKVSLPTKNTWGHFQFLYSKLELCDL